MEAEWVSSLKKYVDTYSLSVRRAAKEFVERTLSAYAYSDVLARRSLDSWYTNISSHAMNGVTEAISGAYMSGKSV